MIDPTDFARFEAMLAADPLAAQSTGRPWMDVHAWIAALNRPEPLVIFDNWFALRPNAGDGDCLFHALAGEDLPPAALREVRRATAAIRLRMPVEAAGNALRVIAALLHTPATQPLGIALAQRGLSQVGNEAMAALQAVAGMVAGETEIHQWCIANGASVLVVDCNGSLRDITAGGVTPRRAERVALRPQIRRACEAGVITLFKTPGHWRRIAALAEGRGLSDDF